MSSNMTWSERKRRELRKWQEKDHDENKHDKKEHNKKDHDKKEDHNKKAKYQTNKLLIK